MIENKRWITGDEILNRWAAMDFELMQAFDAGLCPYSKTTGQQITKIGPKVSKAHIKQPTTEEIEKTRQQQKEREERIKKQAEKQAEKARKQGLSTGSGARGSNGTAGRARWTERDIIHELRESYFKMPELIEYEQKQGIGPGASSSEEPVTEDPFLVSSDSTLTWQDVTITFLNEWEIHIQFPDRSVTRRYDEAGFNDGRSGKPVSAWHVFKKASANREIPYSFDNHGKVEKHVQKIRKNICRLFPNIPGDPLPIDKRERVYKFAFRLKPPAE